MKNAEEIALHFKDEVLRRHPTMSSNLGIKDYDHLWPDLSKQGVEGDIQLMKEILGELNGSGDSEDKELLKWFIEIGLYELETLEFWKYAPNLAGTIISGLNGLLTRSGENSEAIQKRLDTAHPMVTQVTSRVERPVKLWVEAEQRTLNSLFQFLKNLEFQSDRLEKELKVYEQWLNNVDTMTQLPLDSLKFQGLIEMRRLGLTLDEIRSLGEEYLESTEVELKELVQKLGGSSVEEVRRRIRSKHPKDFNEALEGYKTLALKARKFLLEKDIITLPEERLDVIFSYPHMRQFLSIAAAGMPPRFGEQIGKFYLTPHEDSKMLEEHSYAFQPLLISHESYPGHHLHGACRNTHPSIIRSGIYSSLSANTAVMYSCKLGDITEGWGLYCERMMYENGFENDPKNPDLEQRFLQVNALRWRATRVIIDIALHSSEMSYKEAVNYLVENTGYNEMTARSEVLMYSRSPGYFMSYLLGSHMMRELREASGLPLKVFHDKVVYSGAIPLWFLRDCVLHEILVERKSTQ